MCDPYSGIFSVIAADNSQSTVLQCCRLSQVTGEKLKLNNPNITSLDDPYRPTNLVEMVSELYDNEWTDAFEVLTAKFNFTEEQAIKHLLEVMMVGVFIAFIYICNGSFFAILLC